MMQTKRIVPVIILLASLLLTGCSETGMFGNQTEAPSQLTMQSQQPLNDDVRTIQVTGMGEIQVEPDTAVISLGVQTQGETAQSALQENNTRMQALIETLEEADIPSKSIQTQMIHLAPQYEFNENRSTRTLIGYMASNVVEVYTDDLETLGTLLDQAVDAGANTIEGIRFEVSDTENLIDRVRELAVQNARHKAEELATLTSTTLGPILNIQESSSAPGPFVRQFDAPAVEAAVPVSPGSQTVSVQVNMTWVLVVSEGQ